MNSLTARLAIVCLCWLPWLDVSAMVTNKTVTIKPSDPVAPDWDVTLQPKDTANFTVNIVNSEVINGVTYVKSGGPWYKIVPDGPAWSWKGGPTSFTLCNQSPELATASVVVSCKWSRVSSGGGGGVGTPDYIPGSASASADLKVGHIEWQTGPSPLPVFDEITWTVKLVKENGQLVEGMSPQFNMSPVNVTPPCLWVVDPVAAPGPQLSGTVTATNGSKGKLRVDYDYFGVAKYSICPSNLAFVCVDKLRYRTATNASWIDVPTTGVVYLATNEVDVLALREPSDVPWPAGKPVWGGCAGGSGTDQVHVALTPGTVNNVIAECGNVKTGAFAVLKVDIEVDLKDQPPSGKTYASGINPNSIVLKLNGTQVTPTIADITDGKHVFYRPAFSELNIPGNNTVELKVRDNANAGAQQGQNVNDAGNPTDPDPFIWSFTLP